MDITRLLRSYKAKTGKSKYCNKKCVLCGISFDSKLEAKRTVNKSPEKTNYGLSPVFSALTDTKLIKKFPYATKDEDLITPVNGLLPVDFSVGAVLDDDAADAIRYAFFGNFFAMAKEQEKDILFELESGDFETIAQSDKFNL